MASSRVAAPALEGELLVRLYLRFPLLWRPVGRQFLIVARKP